ncbi:LysM peptidoglycan-binding domain-containing protein [Acidithiobacillus caldus]|jgi:membrane-bound lytic murein transglycosylase D|uniref:Membrane-bound lytic murein transglycosylase D n=1 Tax=Acidithiobacillus caldus (strain ATCC 51756 / DSM 8584 / KU) TaxID=637389 RepID=A0A060A1M8_ACICK|nr:LysM peptidoglycan-binding domain-containing protein [Acidithiobacillus caldus]AIA56136.1 Membrane-bound lytic murein transglycosylase D precursor [Acidithiobacillus caldus ATCC 51756]MBU2730361.1 LysM peptidoglycan-binding domain-containing protein [Acidithiobacillus caldus]MBU2735499.1 LysM peptidoglycan-binding domain-containing protein [Acidithiobacillus caldus ATCC 51756]MBU2746175.1 LysM peptidoglycan-binding domain-containing protein [Acidithiobacillus caldus]MBU2763487.1 LysM peptid
MRRRLIVIATALALAGSPMAWAAPQDIGLHTTEPSQGLSAALQQLSQDADPGAAGPQNLNLTTATDPSFQGGDAATTSGNGFGSATGGGGLMAAVESLRSSDPLLEKSDDGRVWTTIVQGFRISKVSRSEVDQWRSWFLQHQGKLEQILNNSRPFLYYVATAVAQRGMPMELALLPAIESGYNPKAFSPAAAAGLWQFVPGTARNFGLQNTRWGDPRLSLTASTNAALDYLSYLYNYFGGNWLLAIAAYNAGQGTVSAAIQRNVAAGKPTDFWSLNLPQETENYVAELLGLAQVIENAKAYHVRLPAIPNQAHIAVVNTPKSVALDVAAKLMDMPVSELQHLNAGLSYGVAPADYPLVVPKNKATQFKEALLTLPEAAPAPQPAPVQAPAPAPHLRYVAVRPGDTLSALAQRYGVQVAQLQRWNHIASARALRVGQRLVVYGGSVAVPQSAGGTVTVRPGESLWQIAQRTGVSVTALARANGLSQASMLHPGQVLQLPGGSAPAQATPAVYTARAGSITVRPGESLWQIAQRAGLSVTALERANGLNGSSMLHPGQVLRLPVADTEVAAISSAQERAATRPHPTTYVVRPGDSVWQIAQRFHVSPKAVIQWNRLASAQDIRPGTHLTIYTR